MVTAPKALTASLFIIAIDGPAGSGKSSAAKAIAQSLGFVYLDTGAMYRAITWRALQEGIPLSSGPTLAQMALKTTISFCLAPREDASGSFVQKIFVNGMDVTSDIRAQRISAAVSQVSAHREVRDILVAKQREYAAIADSRKYAGCVLEGRDIGTVVFPHANLKIFLVASLAVRAERRAQQLTEMGISADASHEKDEMERRDSADSERDESPLHPAPDAIRIDTTTLTFDQQVNQILDLARTRLSDLAPAGGIGDARGAK